MDDPIEFSDSDTYTERNIKDDIEDSGSESMVFCMAFMKLIQKPQKPKQQQQPKQQQPKQQQKIRRMKKKKIKPLRRHPLSFEKK